MTIKSLKKGKLTINTLLTVATLSALWLALYVEAVILVVIFSLGEILESLLVKIVESDLEGLKSFVPKTATVIDQYEKFRVIEVNSIQKGQNLLLRTGDIVPVDSIVVENVLEIQKTHLTGESRIVTILPGEEIYAGSIVIQGSSKIKSIVNGNDSQVHHIVKSVEEALKRKSSAERFGEKFGKYYTPFVFILAAVIAFIVPPLLSQPHSEWVMRALVILVVSCACGLAVSVPVTMISAVASASKNGILIRGGASIEKIGKINAIVFDKTGTLTIGKPRVKEIEIFSKNEEKTLLQLVFALVFRSNHPISKSIVDYLGINSSASSNDVYEFKEIAGIGLKGRIQENLIELIRDLELKFDEYITKKYGEASSYSLIRFNKTDKGVVIFEDSIRPEAKKTIKELKRKGMHISMLTGDNFSAAKEVAENLEIDDFEAQVYPSEKVDRLNALKKKYGYVAMVGDGINDAPALAEADVSFAMGHSGSEITSNISDIVLMEDNLEKILLSISHGTYAYKIAKMNILFSLITVFGLLVLAGLGILDLISGIIANEVTALLIIANGLRLLKFNTNN